MTDAQDKDLLWQFARDNSEAVGRRPRDRFLSACRKACCLSRKLPAEIQREEKAVEDDVHALRVRPASGIFIHGQSAVTKGGSKMSAEVIAERPQSLPG